MDKGQGPARRQRRRPILNVELLEDRSLLSVIGPWADAPTAQAAPHGLIGEQSPAFSVPRFDAAANGSSASGFASRDVTAVRGDAQGSHQIDTNQGMFTRQPPLHDFG